MDGVSRLLAPFRIDDDLPVRPTATFAIVDGERVDGRNRGLLVYRDCSAVGSGEDPSAVVAALLTALNRAAVDRCEFFAAHAGVVAIGGTAVAFPAESGRGKSTLTAACLKAGFEYVSDEAICVDPETDDLIAYPKPIGLSPWSRAALDVDDNAVAFPSDAHEAFVTAGDLGAGVAQGPLDLRHIVVAEYGHDSSNLQEIPGSQAMQALLEMSFNHYKFGAEAFHLASRLANDSRAWRLSYHEPVEAALMLRDRLV